MELLIVIIFIFCAAMAAGSILLVSRLMQEHGQPFLRSLFYHVIFMSAFGFYGVWGQFIIVAVAGSRLTPELISTISVVSLLLGLPFLVFGWLMLLQFAAESTGHLFRSIYTAVFLVANFGVLIALGAAVRDVSFDQALPIIKYYYSFASISFSLISAILFLRSKDSPLGKKDRRTISSIIFAGAAAQTSMILFMPEATWMALIFVFFIFSTTALLVIFLSYQADIKTVHASEPIQRNVSIDDLIRKYEISPREAEIIKEICNGLSNQEIADKLFITLQTVKDHTSHIYSKTNVRSRMQLMTLVRSGTI